MRQKSRVTSGNPFLAWADLAWKLGEMSVASAQVVVHRTARMAASGPVPNARDRKEFALMGQEKVEAGAASARAIATQLASANLNLGGIALRNMLDGSAALLALAGSRNVGQLMARQTRLMRTMTQSARTATKLSGATARIARSGIKPIHARATANARRLAKR
jgi:hypothetical protein